MPWTNRGFLRRSLISFATSLISMTISNSRSMPLPRRIRRKVNHINIVVAIEQHFGMKFKTAEIESFRNVGELVALIARKKAA